MVLVLQRIDVNFVQDCRGTRFPSGGAGALGELVGPEWSDKGKQVFVLEDPDGNPWVMKSFSLITDLDQKFDELGTLDSRLKLPACWKFRAPVLEQDLILTPDKKAKPGIARPGSADDAHAAPRLVVDRCGRRVGAQHLPREATLLPGREQGGAEARSESTAIRGRHRRCKDARWRRTAGAGAEDPPFVAGGRSAIARLCEPEP
jgi:hypothetical protein